MIKRIAIPFTTMLLGIAGALFFMLRFPAVEGLGTKVRLPVYHGALIWATMMMFVVLAVCALWYVVRQNDRAWRWTAAWRWTVIVLWTVDTILGFIAAYQVWDFSASSTSLFDGMRTDPRLMAHIIILIFAIIVLLLPLVLDNKRIRAAFDIVFVGASFAALYWAMNAGSALHPSNPILNSSEALLKLLFFAMVAGHILTAVGLAGVLTQVQERGNYPRALRRDAT